jgi:DNA-binding CsgD family transcriptional regulator
MKLPNMFSSVTTQNVYVVDILQKQFCNVKFDDFFLCGYSVEDAFRERFGFYFKILYPEDLPLWIAMRKAVWRYLKDSGEKRDEIDYFFCTFRLQRKYSFLAHPLPQMVYHRMEPVWGNNELRYLICSIESSSTKEVGNLRMYNKNGLAYEEYDVKTSQWKQKTKESLTERERAILMLAEQGKTTKEIANCLHKGYNTIRNQVKELFSRLNVHSMQEAIEFARRHHRIYSKQDIEVQSTEEPPRKKKRVLLTEETLQRIQQHLDNGNSIRQAAKMEGIAECAIRYWIKKRLLKKK